MNAFCLSLKLYTSREIKYSTLPDVFCDLKIEKFIFKSKKPVYPPNLSPSVYWFVKKTGLNERKNQNKQIIKINNIFENKQFQIRPIFQNLAQSFFGRKGSAIKFWSFPAHLP